MIRAILAVLILTFLLSALQLQGAVLLLPLVVGLYLLLRSYRTWQRESLAVRRRRARRAWAHSRRF